MTAFFVAQLNVKDAEKFQIYAQGAAASMQYFGGQIVIKGKLSRNLAGETAYQNVALVSFPNKASLDEWFESEAYQTLIPLRDEAADMLLLAYDAPS